MDILSNKADQLYCGNRALWDSLKLSVDFQEVVNITNSVIILKCELLIPEDTKATSSEYDRLSFEILASINAVTSLSSNSQFGDELTEGGNPYDLYKLHLPANYTASVQVEPCLGEVELQIFKSIEALKHNNIHEISRQLQRGKITFFYEDLGHPEESTSILFKVQLIIDKNPEDTTPAVATYRIRAHLNNAGLYRQKVQYIPSNEGLIIITQSKSDNVKIQWGALGMRNNEGIQKLVNPSDVEYNIYESPYSSYNLEALCTLMQYTTHLKSQLGMTAYQVEKPRQFGSQQAQMRVYLNVVATVLSTREAIPYKSVEIIFEKHEGGESQKNGIAMTYENIILIVGVVVLLVCLMFGMMRVKSKQMEREQQLRVQDVRVRANIELAAIGSEQVMGSEGGIRSEEAIRSEVMVRHQRLEEQSEITE